jgi:PAB-dependent poly(A)-specific ribonuclease subunit 2
MQAMLLTQPHKILMGGHQGTVVEFDIEMKKEIRQVEITDSGCAILRFSSNYICVGDTSGKITLRDPRSLQSQHVLHSHSGTLSDFDVCNNQLVTCGFSSR